MKTTCLKTALLAGANLLYAGLATAQIIPPSAPESYTGSIYRHTEGDLVLNAPVSASDSAVWISGGDLILTHRLESGYRGFIEDGRLSITRTVQPNAWFQLTGGYVHFAPSNTSVNNLRVFAYAGTFEFGGRINNQAEVTLQGGALVFSTAARFSAPPLVTVGSEGGTMTLLDSFSIARLDLDGDLVLVLANDTIVSIDEVSGEGRVLVAGYDGSNQLLIGATESFQGDPLLVNDATFVAIPEPASAALVLGLFLVGGTLFVRSRRCRQQ